MEAKQLQMLTISSLCLLLTKIKITIQKASFRSSNTEIVRKKMKNKTLRSRKSNTNQV